MKTYTYVSIDIEADGPIPGPGGNSMLSFGAAAFLPPGQPRNKTPIATFERNLFPLPSPASPEKAWAIKKWLTKC